MAERKFTDVELERLLAGDLPASRAAEIEATATAADRAMLDELRSANEAYLAEIDVASEVRAIGRRMDKLAPPRRRWTRWMTWLATGGALAAAAAVALLLVTRRDERPDDIQIKGGDLGLIIHTPDRKLAAGDIVKPGDRLRFEIAAGEAGYVAVIGVDGTGQPTVYFPKQGDAAAKFDPADPILPGAIELDATPGDETFYAVFSAQPFTVATVLPAILNGQAIPNVRSARAVLHKRIE